MAKFSSQTQIWAKSSKIEPSPSKIIQRKTLGLAWIGLAGSSLFKGLRWSWIE
jgi:hypothetical protein